MDFEAALTEADRVVVSAILSSAEKVKQSISSLSQSHGRADFILAISQKGGFPIKTQEYGRVENFERNLVYSHLNIEAIAASTDFISSSEKDNSPDHIGAVAFGKWIISVRGFTNPKMNTATALGIGFGADLISFLEAEKLAHNPSVNCISEYMENEDAFTKPFFKDNSTSEDPLLPSQDI